MDELESQRLRVVPENQKELQSKLDMIKTMQTARRDYELDQTDERIIQLLIEYPNITKTKLGEVLGVTRKTIHCRLRKPSVQRAMTDLRKNGIELIKDVQTQGIRRLRQLIQSKDEKIALDAARFVLLPVFNQGNLTVSQVQERVFRVQFGEGGQLFTDVQMVDKEESKLKPLDLLADDHGDVIHE